MLSDATGSRFFTDTNDNRKNTGNSQVSWQSLEIKETTTDK